MKLDKGRDLAEAGEVLEQWLCDRLDLASWTMTASAVLNLDETVTRN